MLATDINMSSMAIGLNLDRFRIMTLYMYEKTVSKVSDFFSTVYSLAIYIHESCLNY